MKDGRHAAIYLRVSSRSQDLRSQKADLKRWVDAHDGTAVWHEDHATGTNLDRPGWNALWADVLTGKVSKVVVWRLDRLGRTARETVPLFHELRRAGVDLVSLKDGFDLGTPSGRLFAGMLASFAEYETEVRGERQRAGIAVAKAQGVKFGRPEGTLKPTKLTPKKVELVRKLKADGTKVAEIARLVGLSRDTVYVALKGA